MLNPESDTDFETHFTTASDATLCVFVNPRLARLTRSATLLPCFIHLLDGSYGRLSSFPLSIQRSHRIDHRMNPLCFHFGLLLRKEVIQPHLPIRLPCYDFTPVIGLALDGWLLAVTSPALGTPNSHGVTGGLYKARERIHRGMLIRDY